MKKKRKWFFLLLTGGLLGVGAYKFRNRKRYFPVEGRKNF